MPENLAALLTELVDENSRRALPRPVASVAARGRQRQRYQRLTALTSSVVVCAVAAGAGMTLSGTAAGTGPASHVTPPITTTTPPPNGTVPSAPANMFLADTELPDSNAFQWSLAPAAGASDNTLPFPICGTGSASGPVTSLHAKKAQTSQYWSANTTTDGSETIYQYSSAAAARSDYTSLVPDPALCAKHPLPGATKGSLTGQQTAAITDGFAWVQTGSIPGGPVQQQTQHAMVALSGTTIAFFAYSEDHLAGGPKYDTAGDAKALQTMATRLANPNSIPGPAVPPPPTSAFLDASRVPFPPTVGSGRGWVQLPLQPASAGKAAPATLCGNDFTNFVGGVNSTGAAHNFTTHAGTSGEAIANAAETIHAFPSAAAAAAAFSQAQKLIPSAGCHTTINGSTYNYSVSKGATTANGFSVRIGNDPDEDTREYIVVKGTNVAQLNIQYFNNMKSDAPSDDQQVLAALAAPLP